MKNERISWLVMLFNLPTKSASKRVEVWRRLKKYGALALRGSGYLLPASPDNNERFEWLAELVRRSGGAASVLSVSAIDDLPEHRVRKLFVEARNADYREILAELARAKNGNEPVLARLRKRFQETKSIDFFGGPMQRKTEAALVAKERPSTASAGRDRKKKISVKEFRNRIWLTRPRPGIDRAACAWLILNFIDPKARFRFATDPAAHPNAISFDMFHAGGFSHRGDDCSFETLSKDFGLKRRSLHILGEMIHDADLKDEKFGRNEAIGVERVLKGWAAQGLPDDELLKRGVELIDGLHRSI